MAGKTGDYKAQVFAWIATFILLMAALCIFFTVLNKKTQEKPVARKAIFDFSEIDFTTTKKIRLYGEVAFWWDKLIPPASISSGKQISPDCYAYIPSDWNGLTIDNKELPAKGYATYYFQILTPGTSDYALKISNVYSAYSLWVNGAKIGAGGNVSTIEDEEIPNKSRKEFYLNCCKDTIDVVIHVSNFSDGVGGLGRTIRFGEAQSIYNLKKHQIELEAFLFGILFILGLYHFILWNFRRKDKSILFFSLLCFSFLLRLGSTGEKIILDIFPFISWGLDTRLEYLSFILMSVFVGAFLHYLFPRELKIRFIRIFSLLMVVAVFVIIVVPPALFPQFIPVVQVIILIAAIMGMGMVFLSVLKRREFALAVFSSFFSLLVFVINDLLHFHKIIDTYYLTPFGLLLLIVAQSIILSKRNSKAFVDAENLSAELEVANFGLEKRVLERTRQIEKQKEDIEQKANELNKTNKQLEKLIRFKQDITNMMVHDLKNPLNNVIGFAQLGDDISKHKEIIYSSGWEMQNMIQNILDVEKYGTHQLDIVNRKEGLYKIINSAYEVNQYGIFINKIRFESLVPKSQLVYVDREIMERVCANIISNATKYGNYNGVIRVTSQIIHLNEKEFCKVEFYNTGEKIPVEQLETIFNPFEQVHSQKGDYSYSTGIGLTYCRLAIEAHHGNIGVSQDTEVGVTFWFTVPVR